MVAILKTEHLARAFGRPPSPTPGEVVIGSMGFGAPAVARVVRAIPW